jgi:hypothetical protein
MSEHDERRRTAKVDTAHAAALIDDAVRSAAGSKLAAEAHNRLRAEFDEFRKDIVTDLTIKQERLAELRLENESLRERVTDLEGHVEHGPDGSCGVCAVEPEPGAVVIAGFDGVCEADECRTSVFRKISSGQEIVAAEGGKWVHRECA